MTSVLASSRRAILSVAAGAALGGCAPASLLNALVPDGAYDLAEGMAYGDGPRRKLDVYRPKGEGPHPVVVFFYGGSWRNGDRADYRFVGEALAASGAVAILPDYRVHPEARYPDFVEDGAAAVAWAVGHAAAYGGDPQRVVAIVRRQRLWDRIGVVS